MQLKIRTEASILDWNVSHAKQTTPAVPKDDLKLDIKEPVINMKSTQALVKIDQTQCFNESGLKTNEALLEEMVSRSKQFLMEAISSRVEEGNAMMAIESGQNAIAERATYNAWERFYHEFGLVTMPKSRPVITVEKGQVDYDFQKGEVNILNDFSKIDKGTYQAGKIDYYMKQKNSITITPVGDDVDISI